MATVMMQSLGEFVHIVQDLILCPTSKENPLDKTGIPAGETGDKLDLRL